MNTQGTNSATLASWRVKGLGILRIVFGLVWAVDAGFKWQPDFVHTFVNYLSGALEGQPAAVQAWIHFWIDIVKVNPHFFAYLVAIGETAVAIGLIFGLLSNLTCIVGMLLEAVVWTTAEGFGGPYVAGSVDIGAAIIYVLVFASLFLTNAGLYYGVDRYLTPFLGRLGFLAAGSFRAGVRQSGITQRTGA
jgi:nitrite reductase (NO-forming)